jgi:hypothetical protein
MGVDNIEIRHLAIDLSKAPAHVRENMPRAIRRTLSSIEADAKVLVEKDTGFLAGSIGTDLDGDGMGGNVGPTASYGADVEYGTQPHIIRPRNPGGVLAFPGAGGTIFARVVHHPGTSPAPYMGPAFERNLPILDKLAGDIGEGIL